MTHPQAEFQVARFEQNLLRYPDNRAFTPLKCYVGTDTEDARAFSYALAGHPRIRPVRRENLVMMFLRDGA